MFEPHVENRCEGCLVAQPVEATVMRHLLDRISGLEDEVANLRRLDDAIRRNTKLFEVLLSKSHEGITLVTQDMIFLRLVHSVFGHSQADVAGRPVLPFIHPDDHRNILEAFSKVSTGASGSAVCECRVRDRAGVWTWAEIEMTDLLDVPEVQAIVFNYRLIPQPSRPPREPAA